MNLIQPPMLKKEDTIGIIAPSTSLVKFAPHRLKNAIKFLESEGFKIKVFPNVYKNNGWESAPAKERAKELMDAFSDREVNAIICLIGGNTANKILKYINFDIIKNNPKIFCGYSDITILHQAILARAGLQTYYGPSIMNQFAEFPKPLSYTLEYFYKAVKEGKIGNVKFSKKWTQETLNWFEKEDITRGRKLSTNGGYQWLREGKAEGKILGGCLHSICHLLGTNYLPNYQDTILFLETPEGTNFNEGELLAEIDAQLANLENTGIFKKIKGLIIGRPFGYSSEERDKFKEIILDNTKDYNFPVLYGVDIGHTDPMITIPLYSNSKIDSTKNIFYLD